MNIKFRKMFEKKKKGLRSDCILYYRPIDVSKPSTLVFAEKTGISNLYQMVKYCEAVNSCRKALISEYFGENFPIEKCEKTCDNCRNLYPYQILNISQEALDVLQLLEGYKTFFFFFFER